MTHILIHSIEHALKDSWNILPFLFITYLLMEYLEEKSENSTNFWLKKDGITGPFWGAVVGIIPQCGMSAVASNLYAGKIISAGTLIAIFLSTSDEMLPIMISNAVGIGTIVKILSVKIVIAVIGGVLVDFLIGKLGKTTDLKHGIHEFCEHEHCHCEDGILKSAIRHTVRIFLYILLITVLLNILIELVGEERLGSFILNRKFLGPVLAGMLGLIPNCASSVAITKMFLDGFLSFGTMMSGLLVGAGVGILVLFRVNENRRESLKLVGILYLMGVISGILLNMLSVFA